MCRLLGARCPNWIPQDQRKRFPSSLRKGQGWFSGGAATHHPWPLLPLRREVNVKGVVHARRLMDTQKA